MKNNYKSQVGMSRNQNYIVNITSSKLHSQRATSAILSSHMT